MSDNVTPEQWIGPMNGVEVMLLRGDDASRNDELEKVLKDTIRNLEASLVAKRRELASLQAKKARMLREILKVRGNDPGSLPIRLADRPHDQSIWIVVGGQPEA